MDTEGQVDRFIKRLEKRQETVSADKKSKRRKEKQAIVELVDEEPAAEGEAK